MNVKLEKIQMEIAKLQLEWQRIILGRTKVVNSLGSGAVSIGGAAKRVLLRLLRIVMGGLYGAFLGVLIVAGLVLLKAETLCPDYPDADFSYRIGCTLVANASQLLIGGVLGLLIGLYQGHKIFADPI